MSARTVDGAAIRAEMARLRDRVVKREREIERLQRLYTLDTADLKRRVDELQAERHSTNEALSWAVEENHEKGQRIAELEAALVAATGKTYSEAARLLEHTGRDDDAVNLLDNMAAAFEPGGSAYVGPEVA